MQSPFRSKSRVRPRTHQRVTQGRAGWKAHLAANFESSVSLRWFAWVLDCRERTGEETKGGGMSTEPTPEFNCPPSKIWSHVCQELDSNGRRRASCVSGTPRLRIHWHVIGRRGGGSVRSLLPINLSVRESVNRQEGSRWAQARRFGGPDAERRTG